MGVDFPVAVLSQRKSYLDRDKHCYAVIARLAALQRQLEVGHSEPRQSLLKRSAFPTRTGVALLLPGPCRWFVASCYPSKLGKNTSERDPK